MLDVEMFGLDAGGHHVDERRTARPECRTRVRGAARGDGRALADRVHRGGIRVASHARRVGRVDIASARSSSPPRRADRDAAYVGWVRRARPGIALAALGAILLALACQADRGESCRSFRCCSTSGRSAARALRRLRRRRRARRPEPARSFARSSRSSRSPRCRARSRSWRSRARAPFAISMHYPLGGTRRDSARGLSHLSRERGVARRSLGLLSASARVLRLEGRRRSRVLLAGCAAALVSRAECPPRPVGWFWFLGWLVPVIGLVQIGGQWRADRYTYFAFVGLFLAAAWAR